MAKYGFGTLVSQISKSFNEAYDSLFPGKAEKLFPDEIGNVQAYQITNIPDFTGDDWRSSKGYVFEVVRVAPNGDIKEVRDWKPFRLQINPQELTQDEIFAIQVTPTFRGVLVEHQGVTLKDITIQGTTGLSPKRSEGGANPRGGRPVMSSGHSGYEEFHLLRSYFRMYVEAKRLDNRSEGELRLIFRNLKDREHLYVEPQKFTMKRSASKPTLYEYVINMKAVGVASKSKDGNTGTPETFEIQDVTAKLDYAIRIFQASIGLIRRTEQNINETLIGPLRRLNDALVAIRAGGATVLGEFGITRLFVEQLLSEAKRIEANFNDLIGRDTDKYNQATGRTRTLKAEPRAATYNEMTILNSFNSTKRGLSNVLSEKSLFEQSRADVSPAEVAAYQGRIPSSVRVVIVRGGDTVQTIAARELGDPDRYRELVVINNLKPPYIRGVQGGENVLKFGDEIRIPQYGGTNPSTGVKTNVDYEVTSQLSFSEKMLGVDVRLDENNDLAISNNGDLDLISGIQNISQAILLRILLEPGSLKRHPQVGTGIQIGTKVVNLADVREKFIQSIGSDNRIESIPFVEIRQEGSSTKLNVVLKLRNLSQPVPVPIEL